MSDTPPENANGNGTGRTATGAGEQAQPRSWLQPFLLLALDQWQSHGYELIRRMSGFGFETLDRGSVYRTLRQLEKDGLVVSGWDTSKEGPARRLYSLTDAGRTYLNTWAASLRGYQMMLNQFFSLYPSPAPPPEERGRRRGRCGVRERLRPRREAGCEVSDGTSAPSDPCAADGRRVRAGHGALVEGDGGDRGRRGLRRRLGKLLAVYAQQQQAMRAASRIAAESMQMPTTEDLAEVARLVINVERKVDELTDQAADVVTRVTAIETRLAERDGRRSRHPRPAHRHRGAIGELARRSADQRRRAH